MTSRYVTEQVNRALVNAHGNSSEAMRLLTRACATDNRLLREVVAPFLPGILQHTLSKMGGAAPAVDADELERLGHQGAVRPDAFVGDDGEHVGLVYQSPMRLKDGTEITIGSMEIFRVVDGRITEVWNCGYKQGVWQ